ncbi:hypothetical protein [Methylocystis sp. Sn-Cys]|uniref:hypothetical protein n=1 Tax=Methylocystis sp. Sn-Cys TaxID=1701263 RepID=UPI001921E414|nr:hypothetical protein [Methylocystis sp. Sn-Cys]MBL1255855.1 hypothetical protein [Methylocystis sp. Sn-Cys]
MTDEQLSDEEIVKRRDGAIRRALNTPAPPKVKKPPARKAPKKPQAKTKGGEAS